MRACMRDTFSPVFEQSGVDLDGNEPESVSQDLVLDDGRVVVDEDLVDGHCWHLHKTHIST